MAAFREKTAHGQALEDCFPPWYLQQEAHLSDTQAIAQSAESKKGYDFGVDAFFITAAANGPKLVLVQAKHTDNLRQIANGFRDLARSLEELKKAIRLLESEEPRQNKVLVNLRAAINRLDQQARENLELDFRVIHLNTEDRIIVGERTKVATEELQDALKATFPDNDKTIRDVGPADMGERQIVVPRPTKTTLHVISPKIYETDSGAKMYVGLGALNDLVDLYQIRRDDLFSRNVRYYLRSEKNTEKGPAGKMRDTLKHTCVDNDLDPKLFALYHNGVTLHASGVEEVEGGLSMSEPYVLNGCQTIKNAYLFRYASNYRDRIDNARWGEVHVPLRVVSTSDQTLVTTITINNNRQNSISYAALRANDPIQLKLEERFRDKAIFYERQEGAYSNIENSSPELLEDEYENTRGTYVDIVDLARSLAAAAGELSRAEHPGELFESEAGYASVFSAKRIQSITFLTFLQNLHDVMGVVLKKDLDLSQDNNHGPRPSRFKYQTICLLVRYLAKDRMADFVSKWGDALYGNKWEFREEVAKKLRYGAGIRTFLAQRFMKITENSSKAIQEEFDQAERELRLSKNIDPFDAFRDV